MMKVTARYDLVTKSTHNKIMRETMEETIFNHHDTVIKASFTNKAEKRPNFRARSRKWNVAKALVVHNIIPNVLTGLMRNWAFKARIWRFTSTRNSARMVNTPLNIPSTNLSIRTRGQKKMTAKIVLDGRTRTSMSRVQRKEIETPSREELRAETAFLRKTYLQLANKPINRRKRTKRL